MKKTLWLFLGTLFFVLTGTPAWCEVEKDMMDYRVLCDVAKQHNDNNRGHIEPSPKDNAMLFGRIEGKAKRFTLERGDFSALKSRIVGEAGTQIDQKATYETIIFNLYKQIQINPFSVFALRAAVLDVEMVHVNDEFLKKQKEIYTRGYMQTSRGKKPEIPDDNIFAQEAFAGWVALDNVCLPCTGDSPVFYLAELLFEGEIDALEKAAKTGNKINYYPTQKIKLIVALANGDFNTIKTIINDYSRGSSFVRQQARIMTNKCMAEQ